MYSKNLWNLLLIYTICLLNLDSVTANLTLKREFLL